MFSVLIKNMLIMNEKVVLKLDGQLENQILRQFFIKKVKIMRNNFQCEFESYQQDVIDFCVVGNRNDVFLFGYSL